MGKNDEIVVSLKKRFPDAGCTLTFHNDYECLVSIILSAQTTDKSVNLVTPKLFKDFPSPKELSGASIDSIENDIKSLGLYHDKAKHLSLLGKELEARFAGIIPHDKKALMSLPGVGNKTSGVFLLERGDVPAIPVDTHVGRVSVRLGLTKEGDEPIEKEKKLEKTFKKEDWSFLHHALIAFGREICNAKNPACESCPLREYCHFKK